MKLFTIGDSISQGFMSLAAARTELSYSTLIARCLGLRPGTDDYTIPSWGAGGLPLNVEDLLRTLEAAYGSDIGGPFDWIGAMKTVRRELGKVETYYERGPGNVVAPQAGRHAFYPNVSSRGFTVADAWLVTPETMIKAITHDETSDKENSFQVPSHGFERTAAAVLNPSRDPAYNNFSQIGWLEHHVTSEGVENLILWLGSNNALGTIVDMNVRSTETLGNKLPMNLGVDKRNAFNLWTPEHFAAEYKELMRLVHDAMSKNEEPSRVFVGTVPAVTIAPLARGLGKGVLRDDPFSVLPKARYFDRYCYFIFKSKWEAGLTRSLSRDEVYAIDQTIAAYNRTIAAEVAAWNAMSKRQGAKVTYVLVDIARQLLNLAWKRNDEKPPYKLPPALAAYEKRSERPVNTVYYTVDRSGTMTAGGVFSLDGVHPTAIGQGLIAHEFLEAMKAAGVEFPHGLDWDSIVASDTLHRRPIGLMPELYDNTALWSLLISMVGRAR